MYKALQDTYDNVGRYVRKGESVDFTTNDVKQYDKKYFTQLFEEITDAPKVEEPANN